MSWFSFLRRTPPYSGEPAPRAPSAIALDEVLDRMRSEVIAGNRQVSNADNVMASLVNMSRLVG